MRNYVAITRQELDRLMQLTEEQLKGLEEEEFLRELEITLDGLFTIDQKHKDIKKVWGVMQKARLTQRMAEFEGKIAELGDIVMQQVSTKPRLNYSMLLKLLLDTRPELEELIEELKPLATGKPGTQLQKHPRHKEPAAWKKKEHEPLRGRESAVPQRRQDPRELERVIERGIAVLDSLIDMWRGL